ncbi:MAG: hypothetical protein JWO43_98 [Candidatus Adlerbacteria bacterium]|nr:hypothetical protein [Candidatus Adlerbacteria bacterium]
MCMGCMGGRHWGHMLVRILIVLFIFWAGVQFGELKATVENNFGNNMVQGRWGQQDMMYSAQPMRAMTTSGTWVSGEGAVKVMKLSTSTSAE